MDTKKKEPEGYFSTLIKSKYVDLEWSERKISTKDSFSTTPGFVRTDKLHLLIMEEESNDTVMYIDQDESNQ